jgi:hypothetical protein
MMKKLTICLAVILLGCIVSYATANGSSKLIGSFKSNRYHRENCIMVKRIELKNIRIFASPEEAIIMGYVPCKICKPPVKSKER